MKIKVKKISVYFFNSDIENQSIYIINITDRSLDSASANYAVCIETIDVC